MELVAKFIRTGDTIAGSNHLSGIDALSNCRRGFNKEKTMMGTIGFEDWELVSSTLEDKKGWNESLPLNVPHFSNFWNQQTL